MFVGVNKALEMKKKRKRSIPANQQAAPIDKDQHFGYVFPDVAQTHARNVDPTGAFVDDIKAATTVDDLRAAMCHADLFKGCSDTESLMKFIKLRLADMASDPQTHRQLAGRHDFHLL